jgi:glycosyltransferase involved in cell wall biosynthesis
MPNAMRLPVGVLIIARDEETNLPDCLHSVKLWCEQVVVVVDSRTQDRTREVARDMGAEVVDRAFDGYAQQKNWALDNIQWLPPWILILDADERVSPELVEELQVIVSATSPRVAYALRKRFIFYGHWMRHCWYSSWDVRFFQLGKARYEERKVHEHVIAEGELGFLRNDLIHNDFKDMDSWIAKHNRYATLEAAEMVEGPKGNQLKGNLSGSRVERRRFLKVRIWNRLPFRPLWLFVYLYFFKLGVLDGALGFRFCLMHAIFDSFITAKNWERRRLARGLLPNYYREELRAYLERNPDARRYYE